MRWGIGYFSYREKAFTKADGILPEGVNNVIRLILFQPDIPQNTGAILRLGACFDVPVDIIEPCGFVWDDRRLKRTSMDYKNSVNLTRYSSWKHFSEERMANRGRLILFTTKANKAYQKFSFQAEDQLLFGQESAGVPGKVHDFADHRVCIPIAPTARSLNVSQAAAIGLSEALRQTARLPAN